MYALAFFTLLSAVQAHMGLYYPPPFNASNNPHTTGNPDNELHFPHNCCGRTTPMPCRGYLKLLGTPQGASVASWAAGSQQQWSIYGPPPLGGNHYGGSCQIGFSTDQGKTFRVAQSYEGNCPHRTGGESADSQTFPFTVPADLPSGDVVFAWTWFNREQEFFMNCAAVTITGGSGSAPAPASPSSSSPAASGSSPASSGSAPKSSAPAASSTPATPPKASYTKSRTATAAPTYSAQPAAATGGKTYELGDCTCSCASTTDASKLKTKRDFQMSGCSCTCDSKPDVAKRSEILPRDRLHPRHMAKRYSNTPFNSRPLMLFADVNNGCLTPKTNAETKYPNPGPDVTTGDGEYPLELPSGNCG